MRNTFIGTFFTINNKIKKWDLYIYVIYVIYYYLRDREKPVFIRLCRLLLGLLLLIVGTFTTIYWDFYYCG